MMSSIHLEDIFVNKAPEYYRIPVVAKSAENLLCFANRRMNTVADEAEQVHVVLKRSGASDTNRDIIEHIIYLKEKGVHITVSFVCHPNRFYKKELYKSIFSKYDIDTKFSAFVGEYKKKKYPQAYSAQERSELEPFGILGHRIDDWRNFKGIPCLAGSTDVYLDSEGEMFRCLYDSQPIHELYAGPVPCKVNYCGCGFLLEELNTRDHFFWNETLKKFNDNFISCARHIDRDSAYLTYQRLRDKYEIHNNDNFKFFLNGDSSEAKKN